MQAAILDRGTRPLRKTGGEYLSKTRFFVAKLPVTKHSKGRGAKRKDAAFVCHQDRLPTMSASHLSRGAKFSVVFFRKCAKEHGQINQTGVFSGV